MIRSGAEQSRAEQSIACARSYILIDGPWADFPRSLAAAMQRGDVRTPSVQALYEDEKEGGGEVYTWDCYGSVRIDVHPSNHAMPCHDNRPATPRTHHPLSSRSGDR